MNKFVDFEVSERKGDVVISAVYKTTVIGKIETSVGHLKNEGAVELAICRMSYGILRRKMSKREEKTMRSAIGYVVYKYDSENSVQ